MSEVKITPTSYIKEGKKYDRVTTVLGFLEHPKLVAWKLRVGTKESKRKSTMAKKIGTRVDGMIRDHMTAGKPFRFNKYDSVSVQNCVHAYEKWAVDYPCKCAEGSVKFDDELGVAGTPDIIKEGCSVVDIKCSERISLNYWIQVAMYMKMMGMSGDMAILRLDKFTGEYQYVVKPYDERYVSLFIGLLINYRYHNQEEDDDGDTRGTEGGADSAVSKVEEVYGF